MARANRSSAPAWYAPNNMLVSILAAALAFPRPTSPPQPVSSLTWSAPAQRQTTPAMASNGSLRFVVWLDERRRLITFGTRVALDGTPLDPYGIMIPDITSPEAVIWTGEDFAVIGRTRTGRGVVFVGTDATVSASNPVDVPPVYRFQAVSSPGPEARLLFVRYDSNTILYARIVSARGDLLASIATPLSAPLAAPPLGSRMIGAGRRNDFAIFGPSATVRIDRDGRVLANRAVSWPFQYFFSDNIAVAGNDGQGFLLLQQHPLYGESDPTVLACQLDDNAALTGKTATLPLPWFWRLTQYRPVIAPSGQGYIVVNEGLYGDNRPHEYVTELSFDLTARTREVPDAGVPLLLAMEGGPALVVASKGAALYLQPLSEPLATAAPLLLNLSPPTQIEVAVAATPNGYAVAWLEQKAFQLWQTHIRRFSIAGEPLDSAPLEVAPPVANLSLTSPALTATADVYVINGRRLQASTGQWIDGAEIPGVIAAASNGRHALLAVMGSTGAALQQLSSLGGMPAPPVPLPSSAAGSAVIAFRVNLASNGTDYLVVWNASYTCYFECISPPTPIYALHVRADGTWIDAAPIQLSPNGWTPSVAWAGGSYVVTWTAPAGVHATRVGTRGNALDGTGDGVVVDVTSRYEEAAASVVSLGRDAMLLIRHRTYDGDGATFWVGVRFDPSDLSSVATAVRTTLASDYSAAAASVGGRLVLAYSTNLGASTGYVWRAYVQQFADPISRRRVIAR